MSTPPRHPGLDGRARDEDGTIHKKRSDTQVDTLRQEYGPGFAQGARSDMTLGTLLQRTGMSSLSEYLKAGMPVVPPKRS
jgi:hypothetical protein